MPARKSCAVVESMTPLMQAKADDWSQPILKDGLDLGGHDRVLVFAPHPDDESIACGGLLQVARAAGAAVRVIVLTDGDNNPWPQRWIERRWRIGPAERARWGARRREEARAAMRVLDIAEADACFLGLPDLGLTDVLMRADPQIVESLRGHIDEFVPTWLVLPALSDRHPDHSATHILARLALARCQASAPQLLTFAVHGQMPTQGGVAVGLSEAQRSIKQAAILAHASQMRLSQRRFLRYAGLSESYQVVPDAHLDDPQHPLHAGVDAGGILRARIDLRRWNAGLRNQVLFCAIESQSQGSVRWLIRLDMHSPQVNVRDGAAGTVVEQATSQRSATELTMSIPLSDLGVLGHGYVKLAPARPGWRVFDRFGWQAIAFPEPGAGTT